MTLPRFRGRGPVWRIAVPSLTSSFGHSFWRLDDPAPTLELSWRGVVVRIPMQSDNPFRLNLIGDSGGFDHP